MDFEGATVVSKDVSSSAQGMAKYAYDLFFRGNFDMVIAIADNAVGANIAFNKCEGIVSAVCSNADDAKDAKDNGVNVIIVKQENAGQIGEIFDTISGGGGLKINVKMPKIQIKQPVLQERAMKSPEPEVRQPRPQVQQPARKEPDAPMGPARPGIVGWLKDEFGIIDVAKPKQQPKKDKKADDKTQQ